MHDRPLQGFLANDPSVMLDIAHPRHAIDELRQVAAGGLDLARGAQLIGECYEIDRLFVLRELEHRAEYPLMDVGKKIAAVQDLRGDFQRWVWHCGIDQDRA